MIVTGLYSGAIRGPKCAILVALFPSQRPFLAARPILTALTRHWFLAICDLKCIPARHQAALRCTCTGGQGNAKETQAKAAAGKVELPLNASGTEILARFLCMGGIGDFQK